MSPPPQASPMMPRFDRRGEERLLALCASGSRSLKRWKAAGPEEFMAGLAVMAAGVPGVDRPGLLALAERLSPGASRVEAFARWLERTPVEPSRFLPRLRRALEQRDAA